MIEEKPGGPLRPDFHLDRPTAERGHQDSPFLCKGGPERGRKVGSTLVGPHPDDTVTGCGQVLFFCDLEGRWMTRLDEGVAPAPNQFSNRHSHVQETIRRINAPFRPDCGKTGAPACGQTNSTPHHERSGET